MQPITRNLTVYIGETYSNTIYTKIVNSTSNSLIDFSTYTIYGQFRENFQSNTLYLFTSVGLANSGITLSMNSTTTANLIAGRFFYDVFGVISNTNAKIMQGIVTIYPAADPVIP